MPETLDELLEEMREAIKAALLAKEPDEAGEIVTTAAELGQIILASAFGVSLKFGCTEEDLRKVFEQCIKEFRKIEDPAKKIILS